jgi:hypothetical protein
MTTGKCKLCGNSGELKESHTQQRTAYRYRTIQTLGKE